MANILEVLGSICSIAGLGITVWILLKLGKIHRSYLFQARLPELRRKVRGHSSKLTELLNTFPGSPGEIKMELQRCRATLRSLLGKLVRGQRADVRSLLEEIARVLASSGPPSKEDVRRIHRGLVELEDVLENLSKDMKWRSPR